MKILKFVAAIGLAGLSLAGCVDDGGYGGGYTGGYGVVYDSGYYDGGYRPYRRYDNYSYRRWDDRGDYRRSDGQRDRNWQGQRSDRNSGWQRSNDNQAQNRPSRQPDRQNNPPVVRDNVTGPYSPDSCGRLDCTGISTRGSNR